MIPGGKVTLSAENTGLVGASGKINIDCYEVASLEVSYLRLNMSNPPY